MFHCSICEVGDSSRGVWGMNRLPHTLLGDRFYVGNWWDRILRGSHLLCKILPIELFLTWCDWEPSCMINIKLSIEVGDFPIDMVYCVVWFGLWYWCHEFLLFVTVVYFVERVTWCCWYMWTLSVTVETLMLRHNLYGVRLGHPWKYP